MIVSGHQVAVGGGKMGPINELHDLGAARSVVPIADLDPERIVPPELLVDRGFADGNGIVRENDQIATEKRFAKRKHAVRCFANGKGLFGRPVRIETKTPPRFRRRPINSKNSTEFSNADCDKSDARIPQTATFTRASKISIRPNVFIGLRNRAARLPIQIDPIPKPAIKTSTTIIEQMDSLPPKKTFSERCQTT